MKCYKCFKDIVMNGKQDNHGLVKWEVNVNIKCVCRRLANMVLPLIPPI